jgi:hypothetical protein
MPEMKVSVMSHRSSERPHRMTFRRVADLWCWNEMLLQTRPALDLLDQGLWPRLAKWFNVETAFGVKEPGVKTGKEVLVRRCLNYKSGVETGEGHSHFSPSASFLNRRFFLGTPN